MSAEPWFAAVDLGASGGRVAIGQVQAGRLEIEVLHRFTNGPVMVPFHQQTRLYWDILGLWREILHGLKLAGEQVRQRGGTIVSVGVDSWAVDYALLDHDDQLLGGVHHYRSPRTDGIMAQVSAGANRDALFAQTGLQFLPFNTLYQLLAVQREAPATLERAARFLMVPDLLHFWLCGRAVCERTNASTTQLYDPSSRGWSEAILRTYQLPPALFPKIVEPGTDLGPLLDVVADATGLHGARVVVPATHDTASAVAATPLSGPGAAYISSGTWSLVGMETDAPVLTPAVLNANFTNEAGMGGTTRLLKNVMGLWIIQECRRSWGDVGFAQINVEAEAAPPLLAVIDVDNPRFLPPGEDMPQRIQAYCHETGQAVPTTRGHLARVVFESLALKYAAVLEEVQQLSGVPLTAVHVVGGGSLARPLCQWTADASGRPVVAGPIDATLTGNLLIQAAASGVLPRSELRTVVARTFGLDRYAPGSGATWDEARQRLLDLSAAGLPA